MDPVTPRSRRGQPNVVWNPPHTSVYISSTSIREKKAHVNISYFNISSCWTWNIEVIGLLPYGTVLVSVWNMENITRQEAKACIVYIVLRFHPFPSLSLHRRPFREFVLSLREPALFLAKTLESFFSVTKQYILCYASESWAKAVPSIVLSVQLEFFSSFWASCVFATWNLLHLSSIVLWSRFHVRAVGWQQCRSSLQRIWHYKSIFEKNVSYTKGLVLLL